VRKNTFTNLTFEILLELKLANIESLKNPESYYESLEKVDAMFELHQFGGYIYLA